MGKISPVSAKYIVHAIIDIEGVVDRPDVIGAIFGQTEGLLGADLELRELQRSGRIGRIEVDSEIKSGKTHGTIIIPSSLDKSETCIVGAALEIIQRIGPCTAKIKIDKIEDVRISKRAFVIERAKELLKNLMDSVMPDSQELADDVSNSVRMMEVVEYGRERLPAGPGIDESDEIIVVEGRADVLNLLKHGFKNAIAMNGTSVPQTIIELTQKKVVTLFVDGDRGGDLNIREMMQVADVDFVARAPDGKEVEELAKKEIHKALRARVAAEQVKMEVATDSLRPQRPMIQSYSSRQQQRPMQQRPEQRPPQYSQQRPMQQRPEQRTEQRPAPFQRRSKMSDDEKAKFKTMLEDLVGTKGAYILDEGLNILGKVPVIELDATIKSLNTGVYAIILDGAVEKELAMTAEKARVKYLVAMESKVTPQDARVNIVTIEDMQ